MFTTYYNNLKSNGVAGSDGYPLTSPTFRKIALVNGSLTGMKTNYGTSIASENQTYLYLRGYIDLSWWFFNWSYTALRNENKFLPATGQYGKIFYGFKHFDSTYNLFVTNNDSRGSMDVVPGGFFDSHDQLKEQIIEGIRKKHARHELRDYFPIHSFIPTFSSLGHLQPNQNWGNPLNFNLACTTNKLTPFDSYYGSSENTQHTSFTEESVKWLMKELDGQEQAPWFPIKADAMQGVNKLCVDQIATYNLPNDCTIPGKATWIVSSNLQIVSFTDYAVNVKGLSQGQATITATFQNGQIVTKNIHLGGPNVYMQNNSCSNPYDTVCFNSNYYMVTGQPNIVTIESFGVESIPNIYTDYEWEKVTGNFTFVSNGNGYSSNVSNNGTKVTGRMAIIYPTNGSQIQVKARAKNNCGWGPWKYIFFSNSGGKTDNENTEFFTVSPNPANDFINIALANQNNTPASKNDIQAELYNSLGSKQKTAKLNDNKGMMSVSGLLQGVYTLKIMYNDKVESHQVIIK